MAIDLAWSGAALEEHDSCLMSIRHAHMPDTFDATGGKAAALTVSRATPGKSAGLIVVQRVQ